MSDRDVVRKPGMRPESRAWVAVGVWAAAILLVSSLPELPEKAPEIPYLDKFAHACEYAVLGFLLRRAFIRQGGSFGVNPGIKAVVAALAYGGLDELHQLFIPHRDACVGDFLADGFGAFAAQFSCWFQKHKC